MKKYELHVAGLTRLLPVVEIGNDLAIASFVLLGDAELTIASAQELTNKLPNVDILITAEAKGLPLAHELARCLFMPRYVVARTAVKGYMENPLVLPLPNNKMLCLEQEDVALIKGKRVAIIDDVISTGESIAAIEQLVTLAGGETVARASILTEGSASMRDDLIYLEQLPMLTLKA